jgi:hypothetical protein
VVTDWKIVILSYYCVYTKKQQDLDCLLSMIWDLGLGSPEILENYSVEWGRDMFVVQSSPYWGVS